MIVGGEFEIFGSKLGGNGGSLEANFVEIIFIFENSEVGVESFDLVERPGVI